MPVPGGADGARPAVGEREGLYVAGGARLRPVPRQPRVVEQVPSELDARRRHRRVDRNPRRRHHRRQGPPILARRPLTRKRCDRQRHHDQETNHHLSSHELTSADVPPPGSAGGDTRKDHRERVRGSTAIRRER